MSLQLIIEFLKIFVYFSIIQFCKSKFIVFALWQTELINQVRSSFNDKKKWIIKFLIKNHSNSIVIATLQKKIMWQEFYIV